MSDVIFKKITGPNGWLSNMSAHPLVVAGKSWPTAEALFQAMRFDDAEIWEEIRRVDSPMMAKMLAKRYAGRMIMEPRTPRDLENMVAVLRTKIQAHPELKDLLLATGDARIIEDVSARPSESGMFWGMKRSPDGWVGGNWLGSLWMKFRDAIRESSTTLPGVIES
jgi:ribA/ribD-fused uncharacterized protein